MQGTGLFASILRRRPARHEINLSANISSEGVVCLTPEFGGLMRAIPKSALETPSMMSSPERRALYNLAARYYTGAGIIVDAGIFLGASTRCFGEGIAHNRRRTAILKRWPKPVVSFERAIVNPNMPAFFRKNGLDISAAPGELFVDELHKTLAPVASMVDLRIGDILETSAAIDADVEVLFLDVLKLPQISKVVLSRFFPRLIPHRSIVIQQDYFNDKLPYIYVDQEFFGKYFEYIGEINSSGLFRCIEKIPEEAVRQFNETIAPAEQVRLSSVAMHRSVDPARRFRAALSRVRLVFRTLGLDAAKTYFEHVKLDYPDHAARMPDKISETEEFLAIREEARERNRARRAATPRASGA